MPWVSGGWRLETLEASHNPKAPVGPSSVPQTGRVNRETWNQDSAAKGGEKEPHHPQLPEILFLSSACPVRRPSLGVSGLLLTSVTAITDLQEVLCVSQRQDSPAGQT